MSVTSYFIRQNDSEVGPLTIAQINRMRQRGTVAGDTPCRAEQETEYRRLDSVFPHLKDQKGADPEKLATIQREMKMEEITWLTAAGFSGGALFFAPLGIGAIASLAGVVCGLILMVKHGKPIGLLQVLLGAIGLTIRFGGVFSH